MLVAVILGNRLLEDGSISKIMEERLKMAVEVDKTFAPAKIIVSGGVANAKAGVSEADTMFCYLVEHGVPAEKIVKEDRSLTTKQNALFSVPIAAELGATELLLCTSVEHMSRKHLNPIRLFEKEISKYQGITLQAYCK